MADRSAAFRLADLLIEGGVVAYVNRRRAENVSWRKISLELRDLTDRAVDVEPSTLRNWFLVEEPDDGNDQPKAATG